MNAAKSNDPEQAPDESREPSPESPGSPEPDTALTLEEFQRLAKSAQERGEPITELVRRFVISTIDEVMKGLDKG